MTAGGREDGLTLQTPQGLDTGHTGKPADQRRPVNVERTVFILSFRTQEQKATVTKGAVDANGQKQWGGIWNRVELLSCERTKRQNKPSNPRESRKRSEKGGAANKRSKRAKILLNILYLRQ